MILTRGLVYGPNLVALSPELHEPQAPLLLQPLQLFVAELVVDVVAGLDEVDAMPSVPIGERLASHLDALEALNSPAALLQRLQPPLL